MNRPEIDSNPDLMPFSPATPRQRLPRTCHQLGVCLHPTTACTGLCEQATMRRDGVQPTLQRLPTAAPATAPAQLGVLAPGVVDGPHDIEAKRKACIKAVKAAQRQLQMDDETYRAMLQARTGQTSCTACSLAQLHVVLEWLRRAGAVNPKGVNADGRTRGVPVADRAPLMARVKVLLRELGHVTGQPHTLAYADAICARNHWCTRVDFADPQTLHKLVGALSRTLRSKASTASHGDTGAACESSTASAV